MDVGDAGRYGVDGVDQPGLLRAEIARRRRCRGLPPPVFALVVGLDQPLDEVALLQAVAKVDSAFRQNSLELGHRQG